MRAKLCLGFGKLLAVATLVASAGGLSEVVGAQASTAPPLVVGPVDGPCFYSNTYGAPRPNGRSHEGVDIIAAMGTPLVAVADGTISKLVYDKPESAGVGGGNYLRVRVADGTYYTYLHLMAFAEGIALNSRVTAGQLIGYVGQTGAAGTPHLHFEVHPQDGPAIDPTPYVIAAGTCGPPSDRGVPKPKPQPQPVVLSPTIPLARASREGVAVEVVPEPVNVDALPPLPPPATEPAQPPASSVPGGSGTLVYRNPNLLSADRVIGVTVVGFPGLPLDAASVRLSITITGQRDGRAAVWSCGQRSGLDGGIQLRSPIGGLPVTSDVTLTPGDGGRICLIATTAFKLDVTVVSVG